MSTPSQPVPIPPDEPPSQYAYLIPQNTLSSVTSLEDISFPDVQQVYYTTLAIESTRQKELTLPFNAQLGTIQPFTTHHEEIFQGAARHTAERLADTWKVYISDPHTSDNLISLNPASTSTRISSPQSWNPDIQNQRNDTSRIRLDLSHFFSRTTPHTYRTSQLFFAGYAFCKSKFPRIL